MSFYKLATQSPRTADNDAPCGVLVKPVGNCGCADKDLVRMQPICLGDLEPLQEHLKAAPALYQDSAKAVDECHKAVIDWYNCAVRCVDVRTFRQNIGGFQQASVEERRAFFRAD